MKPKDANRYWAVWCRLTALQFETQVANSKGSAIVFLLGKNLRLLTVFLFTSLIIGKTQNLVGYTLNEAIFILSLFVWGSTFTQLLFRAVYIFRQKVQDGSFDFYLLTPLNPLFLSLLSYTDPLDFMLMIPYTYLVGWAWIASGYPFTFTSILLVFACVVIMFTFAFAIHTLIIAIGVRYLEVDNLIMLFRDIEKMSTYPIDIYGKYLGGFLTYVVPIAIIATIPAKIVFGLFSPLLLIPFAILAYLQLRLALWFWSRALTHYTSASS